VRVTWDERKNVANRKKHGISFQEARVLLLSGADYLEIFDEEHSDFDDRFIAIGPIARGIVLVIWTEHDEKTVRIISARLATKRERALYQAYKDRMR
jgi:uncharacterized protein